jgi:HEAT repeat protein
LKNSSGDFRLTVAKALVAHDDIAGLETIAEVLSQPGGLSQNMLTNLAGSLSGLKDSRAIPALAKLIKSNNSDVRRSAAVGLRQTASPAALAPLSELLDDADPTIRYYAVAGLGEITRQNDWAPAFGEFKQDETKYLTYWRHWAQANLR